MRTERELWVDKVNGGEEFDLVIAEPEGRRACPFFQGHS